MSKPSRIDVDLDVIAAEWVVRRGEGLAPGDRREFDRWLAEQPEHWRAYKDSDRIWSELAELDLRAAAGTQAPPRGRVWRGWAAAAAVVVAAVLGTATLSANAGQSVATSRGEVSTVRLADGSRVTLGADSRILVRFDETGRHVDLRRGEAVFDVRRDPARPFEVTAKDTRVTVLGTRFMVKAAPSTVRVDVIHGVVAVAKAEHVILRPFTPEPTAEKIVRGERLESRRGQALKALPDVNPEEVAPWTRGRLVYENASLAEVVADLNRYSTARVGLGSRELGELRVTAALNQDQIAQFLETLPATLPVRLDRGVGGDIVIRPAA